MAWVVARKGPQGIKYKACYRDPSGAERSAGSYPSRRAAERAGQREPGTMRAHSANSRQTGGLDGFAGAGNAHERAGVHLGCAALHERPLSARGSYPE